MRSSLKGLLAPPWHRIIAFHSTRAYKYYISMEKPDIELLWKTWVLTNITGKKWTCPSGFVCVSLKYTRTGKFGHQSSQLTKVEYLKIFSVTFSNQFHSKYNLQQQMHSLPAVLASNKNIFARLLKIIPNFYLLQLKIYHDNHKRINQI